LISKSFLVVVLSPSLALFPASAIAGYVPHLKDYFSYYQLRILETAQAISVGADNGDS
jgi:hypothetical protein